MDRRPFTEKHSKALKSLSPLKKEEWHSRYFHREGIPLLVSAKILRERGLGQIDLGRVEKKENKFLVHIGEVKSSEQGEAVLMKAQRKRILDSLQFLCQIFGHSGKLSILRNTD